MRLSEGYEHEGMWKNIRQNNNKPEISAGIYININIYPNTKSGIFSFII
jgi:hypothetical protein